MSPRAAAESPAVQEVLGVERDDLGPGCYAPCVSPDLRTVIERMNREERLQLLDEVWALVRDDSLAVPTSHADELRARLAKADADGLAGDLWEDVRERVRGRV